MSGAVVGPFAEAVRATFQPCTFLLIVPTLTAVVAARARWGAFVGAAIGAVIGGWILVDNRWILAGWSLRLSAVVVAGLLVLIAASPDARVSSVDDRAPSDLDRRRGAGVGIAVGLVTVVGTMWWRPCVGAELGAILNGAQDGLAGEVVPMAAYMLGAILPVAVVVAISRAVQPPERATTVLAWGAVAVGLVVAASLVAGQHDEVVVTLTRWTLE